MKWGDNIARQQMCNVLTAIVSGTRLVYVVRPEDQTMGIGELSLMTEDKIETLVLSPDFFRGEARKMPSTTG